MMANIHYTARLLGVGASTLYKYIHEYGMPHFKIRKGNNWYIRVDTRTVKDFLMDMKEKQLDKAFLEHREKVRSGRI
jgi:hypothetical protein